MFTLFRRIYDPDKTVKHKSLKQMKAEFKRERELSEKFFKISIGLCITVLAIWFVIENLVRLAP